MLIEALITTGSSIALSTVTFLLARKKYLAEIEKLKQENDRSENENLKDSNAVDILEAAKGLFGDDDE